MSVKWTNELPEQEGWYWWRGVYRGRNEAKPRYITGDLHVYSGQGYRPVNLIGGQWSERIPEPEEP
jgi:hypothetical protein